jgi:hypothetical protein
VSTSAGEGAGTGTEWRHNRLEDIEMVKLPTNSHRHLNQRDIVGCGEATDAVCHQDIFYQFFVK